VPAATEPEWGWEKARARDCGCGDERDEKDANERVSAWGEQKQAREKEEAPVKECEGESERGSERAQE
jgi:hypothetical protein